MTKRNRLAAQFRKRLQTLIAEEGVSRSAFAASLGLDRSTLSQLLSEDNQRLPRAETIAAIAEHARVSVDWLLGLSQQQSPDPRAGGAGMGTAMEVEPGAGDPWDERLAQWHAEAAGEKIRHVPATLPDMMKTQEVIDFEYRKHAGRERAQMAEVAEDRLDYVRRPETDMEIACCWQTVETFALGEGIWRGFPKAQRLRQIARIVELSRELYPSFRWHLYDGARSFSIPFTVFGQRRVAIYTGGMYLVFRGIPEIRLMTQYFDDLVRSAKIRPTEISDYAAGLAKRVEEQEEVPDE